MTIVNIKPATMQHVRHIVAIVNIKPAQSALLAVLLSGPIRQLIPSINQSVFKSVPDLVQIHQNNERTDDTVVGLGMSQDSSSHRGCASLNDYGRY